MPESAASELVSVGQARPSSWRKMAGRFVQEKIIDPHTPEAHYQDIMKKYFRVTDRLEGKPREIAQRIRPQVELAVKAAGWSQTFAELYLAGSAITITAILAGKGLKTAAEVFGGMGRKHEPNAPLLLIGSPESPQRSARLVRGNWKEVVTPDVIALEPATDVADPSPVMSDTHPLVGSGKKSTSKLSPSRLAAFAAVSLRIATEAHPSQVKNSAVVAPGREGREPPDGDTRSTPPRKIRMDPWEKAYDDGIGTDPSVVAQKAGTIKLLQTMMMDRSDGGFSNALAQAMAEPNAKIRQKMVEKAVLEAAEAFGVDGEVVLPAQLLIEFMTSQKNYD